MSIPLLSSTASNAEASQIIGTINGVINSINSLALIGANAPTSLRNAVIGGDFGTNPWARTTGFTALTNTLTYTADRFWARGGASSSIAVSRETTTPPPGFAAVARVGRVAANADTTAIKFGQVLKSADSTRFQGQPFVLSFYARAGATYSAASAALGVAVGTGTGSDESALSYATSTWTGFTSVQLYNQAGAAGSTATLTTSFQRFAFSGVIPTTATQIGFNTSMTPVGTAGATDYFEITGIQLEVMPQGGVQPTPFEWRPASLELALCQHYYFKTTEVSGAKMYGGQVNSTTVASILVPFPVPMRSITTTSITDTAATAGTFTLTAVGGAATNSLAASSGLAIAAGTGTLNSINVTATLTQAALSAAGQTTFLIGAGTTGSIAVSAEL